MKVKQDVHQTLVVVGCWISSGPGHIVQKFDLLVQLVPVRQPVSCKERMQAWFDERDQLQNLTLVDFEDCR